MSAIAESLRRQRTTLLALVVAIVLGGAAWVVISQTTADHLTAPDYPEAAPAIEQAPWQIEYSDSGKLGGLSNQQKARYAIQRKRAGDVVTDVYDGIFLDPARIDDLLKSSFSSEAADSIDTNKLGLPSGATDVTTTERKAHIGLDAATADFAVAKLSLLVEAHVGDRDVEIQHESTLWLERVDNDWKVVAFDLEQGPVK
jgi:hypothetical protein